MRRCFFLFAGLALSLVSMKTIAQLHDAASFTFSIVPPGNHVNFTNTTVLSNSEPRKAVWSFGDGSASTTTALGNADHTYSSTGVYTVCLRIYRIFPNTNDSAVLTADVCKSVTIQLQDSCGANYEQGPASNNLLTRVFYALPWHNNHKKPERVCWNFGDGKDTCINYTSSDSIYRVTHTYSQAGSYNTCVNIKYQGGCESHLCKTWVVDAPPDQCGAAYGMNPVVATPLAMMFYAIPSHNNNKKPERICWTFGDGKDTCINYDPSAGSNYTILHYFPQPGVYNVCLKVRYQGGCEANYCHALEIFLPQDSCRADFERIASGANDVFSVNLHALPWHNNQKKPKRVCWTFGDGKDSCIQYEESYTGQYNINHHYSQPGTYETCINILYYGGCETHKCKPVIIAHDTCSIQVLEVTPSAGSLVRSLSITPHSGSNSKPVRICWTFGDGRDTCVNISSTGTALNYLINHQYPSPGTYHACARVLFAGGCEANNCIEVVIRNNTTICGGYMTDSLTGARTVKFRGFGISNPNDPVVNYNWSFGDGTTASTQDPVHTYREGGTYNVCLTLKMQSGCEAHICKNVVLPGANQTTLQLSPNPVINNLHVVFFSNRNESVTVRIMNSTGMIVRTYTNSVNSGSNTWDFNLTGLVTGLYSVTVQSPNQLASGIFFKQ